MVDRSVSVAVTLRTLTRVSELLYTYKSNISKSVRLYKGQSYYTGMV